MSKYETAGDLLREAKRYISERKFRKVFELVESYLEEEMYETQFEEWLSLLRACLMATLGKIRSVVLHRKKRKDQSETGVSLMCNNLMTMANQKIQDLTQLILFAVERRAPTFAPMNRLVPLLSQNQSKALNEAKARDTSKLDLQLEVKRYFKVVLDILSTKVLLARLNRSSQQTYDLVLESKRIFQKLDFDHFVLRQVFFQVLERVVFLEFGLKGPADSSFPFRALQQVNRYLDHARRSKAQLLLRTIHNLLVMQILCLEANLNYHEAYIVSQSGLELIQQYNYGSKLLKKFYKDVQTRYRNMIEAEGELCCLIMHLFGDSINFPGGQLQRRMSETNLDFYNKKMIEWFGEDRLNEGFYAFKQEEIKKNKINLEQFSRRSQSLKRIDNYLSKTLSPCQFKRPKQKMSLSSYSPAKQKIFNRDLSCAKIDSVTFCSVISEDEGDQKSEKLAKPMTNCSLMMSKKRNKVLSVNIPIKSSFTKPINLDKNIGLGLQAYINRGPPIRPLSQVTQSVQQILQNQRRTSEQMRSTIKSLKLHNSLSTLQGQLNHISYKRINSKIGLHKNYQVAKLKLDLNKPSRIGGSRQSLLPLSRS